MKSYGIEWEKLGTHEQHLDVLDYKKKMRMQEVAVLENKVVCTQHQLESTERVLRDADETLARFDTEYTKKSEAVEKPVAVVLQEPVSAEAESVTGPEAAEKLELRPADLQQEPQAYLQVHLSKGSEPRLLPF